MTPLSGSPTPPPVPAPLDRTVDRPLDRPRAADEGAAGPIGLGLSAGEPSPPSPVRPSAVFGAAVPLPAGEARPLNLARRPFVNTRPVVRAAAILWVIGAVLLVTNVALFVGYLNSSQVTRDKLARMRAQVEHEQAEVATLDGRIGSLSLAQQNREVAYLNHVIGQRVFSWSLLFDRLSEVLPNGVRLLRLNPNDAGQKDLDAALRNGRDPRPQPVVLSMTCEAKSDEAMLRFVDNLFAHPAFAEPNLQSEARMDLTNLVKFELTVQYRPAIAAKADATGAAAANTTTAAGSAAKHPAAAKTPSSATTPRPGLPTSPAGAGLVRVSPARKSLRAPAGGAAVPPGGER